MPRHAPRNVGECTRGQSQRDKLPRAPHPGKRGRNGGPVGKARCLECFFLGLFLHSMNDDAPHGQVANITKSHINDRTLSRSLAAEWAPSGRENEPTEWPPVHWRGVRRVRAGRGSQIRVDAPRRAVVGTTAGLGRDRAVGPCVVRGRWCAAWRLSWVVAQRPARGIGRVSLRGRVRARVWNKQGSVHADRALAPGSPGALEIQRREAADEGQTADKELPAEFRDVAEGEWGDPPPEGASA